MLAIFFPFSAAHSKPSKQVRLAEDMQSLGASKLMMGSGDGRHTERKIWFSNNGAQNWSGKPIPNSEWSLVSCSHKLSCLGVPACACTVQHGRTDGRTGRQAGGQAGRQTE